MAVTPVGSLCKPTVTECTKCYIPTRNCTGLPGNSLKISCRNPLYNNTAHDNKWIMTWLICSSAGIFSVGLLHKRKYLLIARTYSA